MRLSLPALIFAMMVGLPFFSQAGYSQDAPRTKVDAPDLAFYPDLIYRTVDKTNLRLDLAYPKKSSQPLPTVVLLHGSGVVSQKRTMYHARIKELAEKGYVGVFVEYRNSPLVPFPGAIHDVQSAVRWLRGQAGKFPIDRDRFGAVGYSAGGSLACLLALMNPQDSLNGGDHLNHPFRVQACISYFGPSDLQNLHQHCLLCVKDKNTSFADKLQTVLLKESLEQWLGGTPIQAAKHFEKASPISHIRKDGPPLLLLHGNADKIVPWEQSQLFEKQIKAAGGRARLQVFEKAPHDFDELNDDNARRAFQVQWEFLEETLKRPKK